MGAGFIRIISDVHYGDRASGVRSLEQLRPLFKGPDALIINGDTLDTRPDKDGGSIEARRREVLDFFATAGLPVTFLTGNHDPDLTDLHELGLEDDRIFVTHGDILFDSIVPWSRDASMIRSKLIAALAAVPDTATLGLEGRLGIFRSVSASIPQRHQTERNPIKYALRFASDTVWPPGRALKILKAWKEAPARAASLARKHRPKARFVMIGHTHKPGYWKTEGGVTVINTGSFCPPFGAMAADVESGRILLRKIDFKRGQFHPGRELAEFPIT